MAIAIVRRLVLIILPTARSGLILVRFGPLRETVTGDGFGAQEARALASATRA